MAYKQTTDREPRWKHGVSGYGTYGCRCYVCRSANHERAKTLRAARTIPPPDDPRHGTTGTYTNYGCRCEKCVAANSAASRKWRSVNGRKKAR